MLINFFLTVREAGVPASVKEYLTLCEAMKAGLAHGSVDDFYVLARATLVKDEAHFDKFDRAFGQYFKGVEALDAALGANIPEEWLKKLADRLFTEEEKAEVQALGGWEKLMQTLKERLGEQKERHQGGNKWIGTNGTSPFGAYGYNPEGIRIGQNESRNRRAVKVWDQREFRNYDDNAELGVRNLQLALRRLRKFARQGAAEELDVDGTVRATADNAGWLDIKLVPERHNTVKLLLFLDVGGSMDDHVMQVEQLFTAAKTEFKHLEHFYFHNCIYEKVWRDARLRHNETLPTWDVLHKYGHDYKLVIVGDAAMSPYEIVQPGGSVEHWNEEAGSVWLQRMLNVYTNAVWINPSPEAHWQYTQSTKLLLELMDQRMYPLTVAGLEAAMRELS